MGKQCIYAEVFEFPLISFLSITGFSVDWWALGVLSYERFAERSPFDIERASEIPMK